ncbi:Uncharacterised protein [Vibrio cholerae]|uniref:Uncharacterized protein n=1 Tax=Vibrio cholerae TaxID=666 RepID=A0A655WAA7_VIBCL|nr:Uncharacterised protein [Vibrio cholerae]CSB40529.1 Uncharacterised protein [Vibrio cholerae]CSB84568.1 Uncharacterised protein [Vibrio cholerae]CSC31685.1 Uncharacterised protein [Vibrio cholerae]CSC32896.1 Uncharacterised protein [Vibrio cholerae]
MRHCLDLQNLRLRLTGCVAALRHSLLAPWLEWGVSNTVHTHAPKHRLNHSPTGVLASSSSHQGQARQNVAERRERETPIYLVFPLW